VHVAAHLAGLRGKVAVQRQRAFDAGKLHRAVRAAGRRLASTDRRNETFRRATSACRRAWHRQGVLVQKRCDAYDRETLQHHGSVTHAPQTDSRRRSRTTGTRSGASATTS
jgi:hypothetical protein